MDIKAAIKSVDTAKGNLIKAICEVVDREGEASYYETIDASFCGYEEARYIKRTCDGICIVFGEDNNEIGSLEQFSIDELLDMCHQISKEHK